MTLEEFLSSQQRTAWLSEPGIRIYARKGNRMFDGFVTACLDVANVEVEESMQRRGIFKAWLSKAEDLAVGRFGCVMVENVQNEHLPAYLLRCGYVALLNVPKCYVKGI